jgi:hypothetical protein
MPNIRQYLLTVTDEAVSMRRIDLTTPSGMRVQLTEGFYLSLGERPSDLLLSLPPTAMLSSRLHLEMPLLVTEVPVDFPPVATVEFSPK